MERTRKPSPMKAAIIKAGSELFFEKGFSKTTSSELCKKTETIICILGLYFEKNTILLALFEKTT